AAGDRRLDGQAVLARQRVEVAARELVVAIERQRESGAARRPPSQPGGAGPWRLLEAAGVADDRLELRHNLPPALRFSANGLLLDGGTVVLASSGTDLQRCLVMALPIGVLRLGRYAGGSSGLPSAEACQRDEAA
ncbi:hypothetical protein, partial [Synechococcus sp. GFB01]|uniref:hypothetical protein n=1 Tax=Synechococcus sp. GFB01 TaxID=1662190 RepID=UPI00064E76C8